VVAIDTNGGVAVLEGQSGSNSSKPTNLCSYVELEVIRQIVSNFNWLLVIVTLEPEFDVRTEV
jgi:hypothetical protein